MTRHAIERATALRGGVNHGPVASPSKGDQMNAIIQERGNGFADVGDYVVASDTMDLYRVTSVSGDIRTGQTGSGAPNTMSATVEPADWGDLSDEEVDDIVCTAIIEGADECLE